jgi:hypothetical protein
MTPFDVPSALKNTPSCNKKNYFFYLKNSFQSIAQQIKVESRMS